MGCPVCGGPIATDWARGEMVCTQCGLVVGNATDVGAEQWGVPLKVANATVISAGPGHGLKWLALAKFQRGTLHGRERTLKTIQAEVMRLRSCVGLPQHIADEALIILRKHLDVAGGRPEALALAALWLAARRAGVLRPLKEFLKCGRARRAEIWRAARKLVEAAKIVGRPNIKDYVRAVAARAGASAFVVEKALEIAERNRKLLAGKNPWVYAAAVLYVANKKRGITAFARAAGVTEVSVREAAKRLRA